MNQPTPAKLSLRGQLKHTQQLLKTAIANANHGTFVANAMFWKLGLKNREEIKAIVDEYMAVMHAKVEEEKKSRAEGSTQIMEGFINVDATILSKVQEHMDDAATDSSE